MTQFPTLYLTASSRSGLVDALERAITSGELPAGTRLPSERAIASEYSISRSVVREAFRTLIDHGLVEVRAGRGTFVRTPHPTDGAASLNLAVRRRQPTPRDLIEARIVIECGAAALAASRASDEDLAEIEAALDRCVASTSLIDQTRYDLAFHKSITTAAKNPVLETMFTSIAALTAEMMLRSLSDDRVLRVSLPVHREIFEAIRARESEAAAEGMRRHLTAAEGPYGADFDRQLDAVAQTTLRRRIGEGMTLEELLAQALTPPSR